MTILAPRCRAAAAACVVMLLTLPVHAVTINMVPVGNPGNASGTTGYGAVGYAYGIGTYEVTIGQYVEFLNAVAKTDTYGLYNASMASNQRVAGIVQSGSSGAFSYAVTGPFGSNPAGADSGGNRPITYVSWFDAARFANWLANGQPTGLQTGTTTENGAYSISGTTTAPARNAINPNTGAAPTYWIPTENEWFKAAYYSPAINSGSGGYYTYATQSNTQPGNTIGGTANQANYSNLVYCVTRSSAVVLTQNYLTNVGAFTASASYYGTFDQSGNAQEWNDLTGVAGGRRGTRGGYWNAGRAILPASFTGTEAVTFEDQGIGFRLAGTVPVPEPATGLIGPAGLAGAAWTAWRRRRT